MKTNEDFLRDIENYAKSLIYPQRPEGLYEPIDYVLAAKGKRVRPMLTLLGYSLYRDDVEKVMPVAWGIETYHNHTLLHDDLMDNADVRRGRPTVHKKWNENTAILSGDTMLIRSFRLLLEANCERKEELLDLVSRTMIEVCEGQQYDVNFESRTDVSEKEYMEMIRLKTSVLLACALKAGALAADAPKEECDILYSFAERIGLAFQLQDDYLDVYGDASVFGKAIGGDIVCGKKTYLLIKALEMASEADRELLLNLIQNKEIEADYKIKEVTALYDKIGAPKYCQEKIESLYSEAKSLWKELPHLDVVKENLWQFAISMLGRKS